MVYLLIITPSSSLRICHGVITDNNKSTCRITVNFYIVPDGNSILRIYRIILSNNCAVLSISISYVANTNNHILPHIRR